MKALYEFLVPDYYPDFQCKIGACRHTCCTGWPIAISLQDYYNLLGIDCSQDLRQKLDVSLRVVDHPTNECYAQICPGYDGTCGLQRKDGSCGLHAELGSQALSTVCRLYPRGIRPGLHPECSCANSCEAVLEMFLHRAEPISFSYMKLTEEIPPHKEQQFHLAKQRFYSNLPHWETFFEHIFVNHMFFEQFPFQDRPLNVKDEHIGLCAGYAFLRFLCFGCLAETFSDEKLIDVCASAFRLVDHTAFDAFSAQLLKQMGDSAPDDLWDLIRL